MMNKNTYTNTELNRCMYVCAEYIHIHTHLYTYKSYVCMYVHMHACV